MYGPRSMIGTTTKWPFPRCVTRTQVPSGSVRCAAVGWRGSKIAPLAVLRPASLAPYHEAIPICAFGSALFAANETARAALAGLAAMQSAVHRIETKRKDLCRGLGAAEGHGEVFTAISHSCCCCVTCTVCHRRSMMVLVRIQRSQVRTAGRRP